MDPFHSFPMVCLYHFVLNEKRMEKREWKKENGKKRMENVDENDIKRKCVTSKEMNLEKGQ